MPSYQSQNRDAWDRRALEKMPYVDTATDDDFRYPLAVIDPCQWLGDVAGRRVLCLAAGGGRHSVLFAAVGALVTVVDLSPQMLEIDRRVAAERGLAVNVREGSMEDLSFFPPESFDLVIQPVSTCYIPDPAVVYQQVARVLKPGGIYDSQHKQPVSLQLEHDPKQRTYYLAETYYRDGPLPPLAAPAFHREQGTVEYLHRWEQLLGDLCRSGFVIEDIREPRHGDPSAPWGSFRHRSLYAPPYLKIKARRTRPDAGSDRPDVARPGG